MEYDDEHLLQLSGIQHFRFCQRQWALIHIDGVWAENERTVAGAIVHENAHDSKRKETRCDRIITRGMRVVSRDLGFSGECDVVEFKQDEINGICLPGHTGKYVPYPIEYKKGSPKENNCDILQLAAQVMCLEEMLCCNINEGALFYFETKRRLSVEITPQLRQEVKQIALQMHTFMDKKYLPKPKRKKACNACSLNEICMPELEKIVPASEYNKEVFGGMI